jgi:hypothetical protein
MWFISVVLITSAVAVAGSWQINPSGTGDAPTIRAGVDSAASGDTLWLANGTYSGVGNRDIYVYSKRIVFKAVHWNPTDCVIDQGGSGTCITFGGYGGAGFASGRVEGIKITGASTAISAYLDAGVIVEGCFFSYNSGDVLNATGAPGTGYASLSAIQCHFELNPGCAIRCGYGCTILARDCTIIDGGQILDVDEQGEVTLVNCTFDENWNRAGNLMEFNQAFRINIRNCILTLNTGIVAASGCPISLECCDVFGTTGGDFVGCLAGQEGVNGNFSADPLYCGMWWGGYAIEYGSPCAPGNHPDLVDCGLIGAGSVGCGPPATVPTTWGVIKALYR